MSYLPALKRNDFLRVLAALGVQMEHSQGGSSLVKLRYGRSYDSFHVHPSEEVGPRLASKILKRLGIDPDTFKAAI